MEKITIIGNVSTKLEKKDVKGTSVVTFNVAVNSGDTSHFYRISAWRGLGDVCLKYLDKGSRVAVVGKLNARLYESNNKTFMSLDVTADDIEFLSPAKKTDDFSDVSADDLPF